MSCLLNHRWIYDFRLYHVYRKCQYCDVAQRHAKNGESVYTAWEPVRERTHIESERRQIVQKRSRGLARLAHSLRLMRARMSDRTMSLVRST